MIVPRKVEPDAAARVLRVTWVDGHESVIPLDVLRSHCPCARCRDVRERGMKPFAMALTTKLAGWKRIGNYALNFQWADSHQEGIYAYDYLRRMCPCGACDRAADRTQGGAG